MCQLANDLYMILPPQEDGSTPLHLAASQGSVEIVNAMRAANEESFCNVVHKRDCTGRTPLHRAAILDHVPVCEILLQNVRHSLTTGTSADDNAATWRALGGKFKWYRTHVK